MTVRPAAALGALVAIAATALVGDRTLPAHMVQHALLGLVAAPLLVIAAPVRFTLRHSARRVRRGIARALTSRPVRLAGHPAGGLTLFTGTLAVVHLPAVYDAAERSVGLHALVHGALFWSAVALWVPLLGAEPVPHRTGAIARVAVVTVAMAAMGVLGAVLAAAPAPLYAAYPDLAAQREAGGVMWIGGMAVVLPVLLLAAWSALAAEERRQRTREVRG
ncbi:MAG: putative rane protein [Solirubrobacteraceae bacterium]|nr:putative rane protein [Solirubrobacteraceae bacterium]